MTDTTTSLRPVIAEILHGLGRARVIDAMLGEVDPAVRMFDGANTLRWAHEFEETPTGDEVTELDRLRELVREIEDLLGATTGTGKPIHPGTFRREVEKLVDGYDRE